jgi:hypothetical protein
MRIPSRVTLAVLVVFLYGIAGCSGSSNDTTTPNPNEHAVLIHLDPLAAPNGRLTPAVTRPLEAELAEVVMRLGIGVFDGNEFAANGLEGTLFVYGSDADRLFEGIEMTLRASPLCRNARVELRYGAPGSKVREIRL